MALKKPEITSVFQSIYNRQEDNKAEERKPGEKKAERKTEEKKTEKEKKLIKDSYEERKPQIVAEEPKNVAKKAENQVKNSGKPDEEHEVEAKTEEKAGNRDKNPEIKSAYKEEMPKTVTETAETDKRERDNENREKSGTEAKTAETKKQQINDINKEEKAEYWVSASVMLDPVNLDFIRKMSRHLRLNQQEYVCTIVEEERKEHEKEIKIGNKMVFTPAKPRKNRAKKDKIQYNLRLPRELLDFLDSYAEYRETTRSAYFDGIVSRKMNEYLES